MRMMCDRRKDKTNLSHFHTLAGLLFARGKYAEAEGMERDVKVWLEEKNWQGLSASAWSLEDHRSSRLETRDFTNDRGRAVA
jgi:hypothetical protein